MAAYCCWGCEAGYGCEGQGGEEYEPVFYTIWRGHYVDPRGPEA